MLLRALVSEPRAGKVGLDSQEWTIAKEEVGVWMLRIGGASPMAIAVDDEGDDGRMVMQKVMPYRPMLFIDLSRTVSQHRVRVPRWYQRSSAPADRMQSK